MARLPSIERLHELFDYDPDTGWLIRRKARKDFVGKRAGSADGPLGAEGHRRVRVDGVRYFEHKVVWAWYYGEWPGLLDHKNRDAADNRIRNLRPTTVSANNRNCSVTKTKKLPLGVHANPGSRKNPFRARINLGGRIRCLGSFPSKEAASAAYLDAKRQFHPEYFTGL